MINFRKIEAALRLDEDANHWTLELRPVEALEFCARCTWRNEASPLRLVTLIEDIDNLIPPMNYGKCNGKDNPNNGKTHHTFTVGRENSRVLYLNVIKAYMPANTNYDNHGGLADKLIALGRKAQADEAHITENDSGAFTFRFWWD